MSPVYASGKFVESNKYSALLIINGKEVVSEAAVILYDEIHDATYQEIPLIFVLKELGAHVFWIGSNALIYYKGAFLYLDTSAGQIKLLPLIYGNYFDMSSGDRFVEPVRKYNNHEYIVDSWSLNTLFKLLDIDYNCNFENKEIVINSNETFLPKTIFCDLLRAF